VLFHQHSARSAAIVLAVLSVIWGYNWVIMKQAMRYSGPFDFAALRTVIAAIALFLVLLWLKKPLRPVAFRPTLLLGLLQTTGFMALSQWALVAGGAGKTAVLAYTMPFWVLLLAWPLLNERIHGWQWPAVLMALAGLILIVEPWNVTGTFASNMLAVLSGMAWGGSAIVAKRLRSRATLDLLSLTAWQMTLGGCGLLIIAALVPSRPIAFTGEFIVLVAYVAVVGTALGWLMWLYVLNGLPAGVAALGSLAIPIVGVAAAWIQLGERPSETEMMGMLLIGIALAALSYQGVREHASVSPAMGQE
jgi:drug/metabolite transporter (DMT)-like permease